MSRAEAKARTREALLDSALQVFTEKGFNAATVEEIAAGAGFTRGAFYANFADKGEAFWAVMEREELQDFDRLEADLKAGGEDTVALDTVNRWFASLVEPRPLRRAFDEAMAQPMDDPTRHRFAETMAAVRQRIIEVLELETTARGVELPVPVEHLATAFLAVGNGLMTLHRLAPELVPPTLYADTFAWLWLGSVSGS